MGRGGATSQQRELFEDYEGFVAKFEPKKTTDDCYTPPLVYDAVRDWACAEYGIDPASIVRPFYPGGDYEAFGYPEGCTVLDNPPFSILTRICGFYVERGIRFFLFAPGLTIFSATRLDGVNAVCAGAAIVYENGASVNTSFVTDLGTAKARSAPALNRAIRRAVDEARRQESVELPRYEYPDEVLTAAKLNWYSNHGTDFAVGASDCLRINAMDAQRACGKAIFGAGLLLSERAAAERAVAERAVARRWELSPREREMQRMLG